MQPYLEQADHPDPKGQVSLLLTPLILFLFCGTNLFLLEDASVWLLV